jgi:DNA-binding transcriptional LysR family regulator
VKFITAADKNAAAILATIAQTVGFEHAVTPIAQTISFRYDHGLSTPIIWPALNKTISDLAFEPLMGVQLRLALGPDHRIAKLRRVPLAKLAEEKFIIFKRSAAPATHDFILRLYRSAGFEPYIVKQSDQAQSILDLVAAGVGTAIVPEHFQRYRTELLLRQFIARAVSLYGLAP